MIAFLCSRPVDRETNTVDPSNGFLELLLAAAGGRALRGLHVASDPEDAESTAFYADLTRREFEEAGLRFDAYRVLDGWTAAEAPALVAGSDFIVLAGGHVPTQNRFFNAIGLKALLAGWEGVLIGISAGTMNAAATVYAQPEQPGEATDPTYERFLPGLGLTEVNVLPHYQLVKDEVLDGLRVFEDVTYPDSLGRCFYALPDGSFLYLRDGKTELRGEAWRIADGRCEKVCEPGRALAL